MNTVLYLIILLGVGLYVVFSFFIKRQGKRTHISRLKASGIQIDVDLNKCRILCGQSGERDESDVVPSQAQMLDSLVGRNNETVSKLSPVVQIVYDYVDDKGNKYKYASPLIRIDEPTLRFKIMQHPTTKIYVDSNNRYRYYFDLSFINS